MRGKIANWIRRNALKGVLTLLVVLSILVVSLVIYFWVDDDRAASMAALAIVPTTALAFAAALAYQQNARLVEAATQEATEARKQAMATTDQAIASRQAVDEVRNDREWAYRPLLVITGAQSGSSVFVVVTNIGTGPALNVRLAAHKIYPEAWQSWELPDLAPRGEAKVFLDFSSSASDGSPQPNRYRCIVDDLPVAAHQPAAAVRYEDWFGAHYRSGGPPEHDKKTWRAHSSLKGAPPWVRCR
jgi:hypothetical protein